MAWKDLSIAQRSQLMNLYRRNGIMDLSQMRQAYDAFSSSSQEGSSMIGNPSAPIYAGGGHKFDGESEPSQRKNYNGQAVTLEAYKEMQRQAIRDAAVKKALTRTTGVAPIINGKPGSSCIYTFTDNYGRKYQVAGTQTFAANPEKYGFEVAGPITKGMGGNMYLQINEKGTPCHATMITGYTDSGEPLLTYSSGHAGGFPGGPIPRERWDSPNETYEHYLEVYNRINSPEADYNKNRKVWPSPGYETYRFIGTPEDNARWAQEWENLQGYPQIAPIDTLSTGVTSYAKGGRIHIKKENRGKFTALKKRTGHSASWFKAHGTPAQKKMAVFELNSRKWSHKRANGGYLLGSIYDLIKAGK